MKLLVWPPNDSERPPTGFPWLRLGEVVVDLIRTAQQ